MGISERSPASVGVLWNAFIIIGHDGAILNHHRKLVPTFYEKLTWASGDGVGLKVVETPVGRGGQLIYGEHQPTGGVHIDVAGRTDSHLKLAGAVANPARRQHWQLQQIEANQIRRTFV